MCGRYVLKREDLETIAKQFGVRSLQEFRSRYNIAPTSIVPVLRRQPETGAEAIGLRWGLIPAWTKPNAPAKPLINVRSETVVARFKGALSSRRCLVPATGFFEWQPLGSRKQPWYFTARGGGPLRLAGIWDTWRGSGGVELETCTILTTAPNRVLQPIHDRMPVILSADGCHAWLDESDPTKLERLLTPAANDGLVALRVGPAIGSARNDGPESIAAAPDEPPPPAEPQLSLGF